MEGWSGIASACEMWEVSRKHFLQTADWKNNKNVDVPGFFCWVLVGRKTRVFAPEAARVAQFCSVL